MTQSVPKGVLDGRYELLERLGRGGMAEVIRGWDRRLRRDVAIKFLAPRYSQDPGVVDRFRQEIAALAQLDHPHVVTVFDTGETDDGRLYLVMERLQGETLDRTLRALKERGEGMGWARLAAMARQLCGALQAAHDRQIVHRDIKPSNIFRLSVAGNRDFLKLLDFGIAKVVADSLAEDEGAEGRAPLTAMGAFVGTPHYAAPELIAPERHGPPGPRADLFSLGVILYECATGALPLEGIPKVAVLSRTAMEPLPPPSERAKERSIPKALETIILRATALSPGDRFESARAMEAALAMFEASVSYAPQETTAGASVVVPAGGRAGEVATGRGVQPGASSTNRSPGAVASVTGSDMRSWSLPTGFDKRWPRPPEPPAPRVAHVRAAAVAPPPIRAPRAAQEAAEPHALPEVKPAEAVAEPLDVEERTTRHRVDGEGRPPEVEGAAGSAAAPPAVVENPTTDVSEGGGAEATSPAPVDEVGPQPAAGINLWGTLVAVALAGIVVATWVWMPPATERGQQASMEIVPGSAEGLSPRPEVLVVTTADREVEDGSTSGEVAGEGPDAESTTTTTGDVEGTSSGGQERIYVDDHERDARIRACKNEVKRALVGAEGSVRSCLWTNAILVGYRETRVRVRASIGEGGAIQATITSDNLPNEGARRCIRERMSALEVHCTVPGVARSHEYLFPRQKTTRIGAPTGG